MSREKNNTKPIAVFDSGVGGLTVAAAIKRLLPNESIIYLGDLLHLPYGSKSAEAIIEFTDIAVDFLMNQDIKLLTIACNTSTSVALDFIRSKVKIPVIGVIRPGAEAAVRATQNNRIGVIGTKRTIESDAYKKEIEKISAQTNRNIEVCQKATPLLVPLIEEGWKDHFVTELVLKEYLNYFEDKKIDTLVLGCTHYPLIRNRIGSLMHDVKVVDSAETTSLKVKELLVENKMLSEEEAEYDYSIYLTDYTDTFGELAKLIIGNGKNEINDKINIISLEYSRGKSSYNLI